MTGKSLQFKRENDVSPVVAGVAKGNGGEGAYYTLENGKRFSLSLQDCLDMPSGYPKWRLPARGPRPTGGSE